jgi:phage/conjugal plasmid C-4 type zinc finger TraR family protein
MDDVDRGQARAEEILADALAEQARRHPHIDPGDWERASAKWCAACGDRVPDRRRRALPGVQLCVECARDAEVRR